VSEERVQIRNPITDRWVKVDARTGRIVGHKKTPGPYKGIPLRTPVIETHAVVEQTLPNPENDEMSEARTAADMVTAAHGQAVREAQARAMAAQIEANKAAEVVPTEDDLKALAELIDERAKALDEREAALEAREKALGPPPPPPADPAPSEEHHG
jgi:G3E family GTPase